MTDTTTTTTLASRAAGLLSKTTAYAIAEKAMAQAIAAKRVYPALATDFSEQLGVELPLKTRDFVRVVGHLLAASEKPIKGAISKRKSEILAVLSELVGALTDTPAIELPEWAKPKERSKKTDETADVTGALDRANAEAAANEAAEANAEAIEAAEANAEALATVAAQAINADIQERALRVTQEELHNAVLTVKELSDYLTPELRAILVQVLGVEPAIM